LAPRRPPVRAILFDAGHTRRRAGLEAVLFDPGGVWGARDCAAARGLRAAVEQAGG
jgi:hypothetical protein